MASIHRRELLMKPLLIVLLLAGSAAAQSFYPNLAGKRYCELRGHGVGHEEALRAAMKENWSSLRPEIKITAYGVETTTDNLDLMTWVLKCK